jgi:hypothetical protein
VRLAPDVYTFRHGHYVSLFFISDEGVLLVDPIGQMNPRTPRLIKEAISTLTERPVKHVLYSHWGEDHGMGGSVFADTASYFGHKNSLVRIIAANDANSPSPDVTFDIPTTIALGDKTINLYPADMYDNDDYVIVHCPERRIAMFVDVVQPRSLPFGSLLGKPERVIDRLQWVHDMLDFDILISGHNDPSMFCTKQDVLEQQQYFRDLVSAVQNARIAGLVDGSSEMQAAVRTKLEPQYGTWRRFERFVASNVEGVIGWKAGKVMRAT